MDSLTFLGLKPFWPCPIINRFEGPMALDEVFLTYILDAGLTYY